MTEALRVLVVEDDNMIGLLLGEMLGEMGHAVCAITATESEAVDAAALHRPGLIIIDAHLGPGSGLRAMDEILLAGFVPHFFISGDIAAVRALRPDSAVLEKPFKEARLARAIQQALRTAKAQRLVHAGEAGP